jgi:hypothetical protein
MFLLIHFSSVENSFALYWGYHFATVMVTDDNNEIDVVNSKYPVIYW